MRADPRRVRRLAVILACLVMQAVPALGGELDYPGPPGGAAEKAADSVRGRLGADRVAAAGDAHAVADRVRSGAAAFGLVPADSVQETLLAALDPGLRIARRVEHGDASFWAVEQPAGKPEDHPDHVAVNIESERGAKAFSDVVEGFQRLGFSVEDVARVRLPVAGEEGRPSVRFLIVFSSDKPMLLLRVTDVLARDVRIGEGRARLIGAWRQAG